MLYQIKSWLSGKVLFESDCETFKVCVELAVKSSANLEGADLGGANLGDAYLRGSNLRGANLGDAYLRGSNLRDANLRGAYLGGAYLRDADLEGANLRGANLGGANLGGSNLRDANLEGANLGGDVTANVTPIQLLGLESWDVLIFDNHLKIGCQIHTFSQWKNFSDEEISEMDSCALDWWNDHKDSLFSLMSLQEKIVNNLNKDV